MMAWFRSHHPNQSWLTALTAMIDCTAVICLCAEGDLKVQAEFTFAMGRHALVDITSLLHVQPCQPGTDRLSGEDFAQLRDTVAHARLPFHADGLTRKGLAELRVCTNPTRTALAPKDGPPPHGGCNPLHIGQTYALRLHDLHRTERGLSNGRQNTRLIRSSNRRVKRYWSRTRKAVRATRLRSAHRG